MIHFVSAVCLAVLIVICTAGIFSPRYHENWMQFAGLVGMVLWGVTRFVRVIEGDEVTGLQLIAHISLAVYAIGTAYKVCTIKSPSNPIGRRPVT